ncbi:MAG: hypothetical protein F6J95_026285 [Leptolyngbya sp. SIO1E4]|nr:hypothetical protein [Leptolyngbya sp. SIO1E4]
MGTFKYLDPRPFWQLIVFISILQIGTIFILSLWSQRNAGLEQKKRNNVRFYRFEEYTPISKKHPLKFSSMQVKYKDESSNQVVSETSFTFFGNQTTIIYDGLGNAVGSSSKEFSSYMVLAFVTPIFLSVFLMKLLNMLNILTFHRLNLSGLGSYIENTSTIYAISLYVGLIVSQLIEMVERFFHKRRERFRS